MRAKLFISVLVLVAAFAAPRAADACTCIYSGPACQVFWKTDAVFDATVESIESTTRREDLGGTRSFPIGEFVVKMNVRQAWKGVQPGPLEVVTNQQGSACGYKFQAGRRYLVFAHKRAFDGRWGVSTCSLTKEFDGTGDAADFLGSLARPPRGGRIFGTVRVENLTFSPADGPRHLPVAAHVRLVGGGKDRSVVSNEGRFEFTNLAEGHYRLELQLPEGHTTYQPARDVNIPNAYACAEEAYFLSAAGRITGRVVGPNGRPVPKVRIETTGWDLKPHRDSGLSVAEDETDSDGYFEIERLPPGRYILGVNLRDLPNEYNPYARAVYPDGSEPHALELALGQTIDVGTWRLPAPLAPVRVTGIVTWQDGTAAANVVIWAWDETGNPVERFRGVGGATTKTDGQFVFTVREHRIYALTARDREGRQFPISPRQLDTTVPLQPLRIVIQQNPK